MNEAFKEARVKAQDILARREHSRRELERKLGARGFDAALIAEVLDGLERERLLSDARFSEQFAHQRIERGQGPLKILSELGRRGVDDAMAREHVQPDDPAWVERAERARSKRFGARRPKSISERARQVRFLAQRGFTAEQASRVLFADHADEEAD